MSTATYNGWANYATWNVSLWIQNEYHIYKVARQYDSYDRLLPRLQRLMGDTTPDGISWSDKSLDHEELDEMLTDL